MSDTTPTPADLARELIRRIDAHAADPGDIAAFTQFIEHRGLHARTIAEALLAAERYIATLEFANEGNKIHIASIEGRLAAAEARVAELEAANKRIRKAMVAMMEVQDCTDDCWCDESEPDYTCEACVCRAVLAKGKGATP